VAQDASLADVGQIRRLFKVPESDQVRLARQDMLRAAHLNERVQLKGA
jgi:hypothetical protein